MNSIETVIVPDECDNSTKRKNFVLDTMKNSSFTGFLHMLEDNVVFFKDPHEYIATVEKTMSFLDYDVYFSTVTDPCNYLFTKFNPRITLDIDDPKLLERGISKAISFTSHSNTAYVIYNYAAFQTSDVLKFNESFNIAMFNIIEFLARRKFSKKAG